MNREQLAARVLELVTEIAPDVDSASVIPGIDFRDQFDFDSMDLFNFAAVIHESFGIDIPDAGYTVTSMFAAFGADIPCAIACDGGPCERDYQFVNGLIRNFLESCYTADGISIAPVDIRHGKTVLLNPGQMSNILHLF